MTTDAYVRGEWAIAKRPGGGYVLLGAPAAVEVGYVYRVVWPIAPDNQALVESQGQGVWASDEFAPTLQAIGRLIDGLKNTGEYTPEPAFDLAAWVASYEGAS